MPIGDTFAQMLAEARRAAARPRPVPMSALNAYTPQGEQPVDLLNDWVSRAGKSTWAAAQAPGNIYSGDGLTTTAEMVGPAAELARLVMGGTRMGAPAGAVGAGPAGRRLGKPDFDRILTKQRAKDAATMQRTGPEINRMPAVIDAKGNTYEGFMHADAIKAAQAAGAQPADWYWPRGYVTNKGRFVLRPSDDAGPNWLTELLGKR